MGRCCASKTSLKPKGQKNNRYSYFPSPNPILRGNSFPCECEFQPRLNPGSTHATTLWSFSTDGSVYHPPVVSEGYVCITSSFVTYSRASLYCLNASNGAQIWNRTTPKGYGFTQPIIANGIVYTDSYPGIIFAFNASTGAVIWSKNGSVSTIDNGVLYGDASSFAGIQALDSSTGETIWKYRTEYLGPVAVANGYAYIYSRGLAYAIDAAFGVKKWSYNTTDQLTSLMVAGDHVYVRYNNRDIYGNVISSGVFALSASTGEQVWGYKTDGYVISPVVSDELIYVGSDDGNVNALNVSSGKKIWNYTTDGSPSSSIVSDRYLYVSVDSRSGNASLYCFNAVTGAKVWNFTTELGNEASSPVVVDGQIYVGNTGPQFFAHRDHYVYALNASTGEQIWNYTIVGNAGSLTVADGVVYVSARFTSRRSATSEGNGAVYALKPIVSSPLPSTLVAIAVVVVAMILTVVFLVYRIKLKRAKSPPPA
jgi:outer membrane protein assembly factor BamB